MELAQLLDPKARFIFLVSDGLTNAFPIVHVAGNQLYFTSTERLPEHHESGYFPALDGEGIVQFGKPCIDSADLSRLHIARPVHRIDFSPLDFTITNRRLHLRHEFKRVVPIVFQIFGETLNARLVNISAGGLRMCVSTPIQKNIRCHFEIRLRSRAEEAIFKTDGLVVYADPDDYDAGKPVMVGVSFVTPEGMDDSARAAYKESWQRLEKTVQAMAAMA